MSEGKTSSLATVIFDRDGTVLDFYEMFHRFILDLHDEQGVPAPSRAEIVALEYWTMIQSGQLRIGPVIVRDRVDDVVRRYMPHARLYPGVAAAVRRLAASGVRLALVSGWVGTADTVHLLETAALAEAFDAVATRDDLPDGGADRTDIDCKVDLARQVLSRLGHRPRDSLFVVGDSPADAELGQILGAVTIGVRTGNGTRTLPGDPRLHLLLDSAADVPDIVLDAVVRTPS